VISFSIALGVDGATVTTVSTECGGAAVPASGELNAGTAWKGRELPPAAFSSADASPALPDEETKSNARSAPERMAKRTCTLACVTMVSSILRREGAKREKGKGTLSVHYYTHQSVALASSPPP
jgi:hypothetical protein